MAVVFDRELQQFDRIERCALVVIRSTEEAGCGKRTIDDIKLEASAGVRSENQHTAAGTRAGVVGQRRDINGALAGCECDHAETLFYFGKRSDQVGC